MTLDAHQTGAWWPADDLGVLRISGRDAVSYLHTKLTVDTRPWAARGGAYAFAVDINGRIVFDAHFRVVDGVVLAVVPRALLTAAQEHLEKWVIVEDVVVTDVSSTYATWQFVGSSAFAWLSQSHDDAAPAPGGDRLDDSAGLHGDADESAALPSTLAPGAVFFRWTQQRHTHAILLAPAGNREAVETTIASAGLLRLAPDARTAWEAWHGIANTGRDLVAGQTIPLEAGAWHGVEFNKGCYLGQEVIERLYSKGRPARRLWRVSWQGPAVAAGTALSAPSHTDAGSVTVCTTDTDGLTQGIAWVRRAVADDDLALQLPDGTAVTRLAMLGGETAPESRVRPRGKGRGLL